VIDKSVNDPMIAVCVPYNEGDPHPMATGSPFTRSARTYLAARAEPFDRGFAIVGIPLIPDCI
jgi:hypothetical protein